LGWVPDPISAFPTYYPAVFFAALIGGAGPGAFAAIAGGFVGWWAFIPQRYELFLLKSGQEFNLAAYLIASLLIVWGANRLRALTRQVEGEERLRKLAVEELAHRLKNKLAILQSIVSYRLREHPQIRDDILGRLNALSVTDGLIIAAQGRGAHLQDILSAELEPYDASRVFIEGPDTFLSSKLALMAALLFHELATNAAKYGALSSPAGRLSVNWTVWEAQLSLKWRESGGPAVSAPIHRGFGTRLLSGALDHFDGKLEMSFEPVGVICTIGLKLAENVPSLVPKMDTLKVFSSVD
jgi:two-component sensor histidine kinase